MYLDIDPPGLDPVSHSRAERAAELAKELEREGRLCSADFEWLYDVSGRTRYMSSAEEMIAQLTRALHLREVTARLKS